MKLSAPRNRFAVGLASASMLALFAGGAVSATVAVRPVTHTRGAVHRIISALPGAVTLYDQNDDDSGVAVLSSSFDDDGPFYPEYNSFAADDFVVPSGHKWKIREVDVTGTYALGSNPPRDIEVLFYRSKKGLPSVFPVIDCWADGDFVENQGSFAIKLPKSCRAVLKGGKTYWVAVVPLMFEDEWTWETRNGLNGKPAAWKNPANGFGTGCTAWRVMTSCISTDGVGPDFMFTLKGNDFVQ